MAETLLKRLIQSPLPKTSPLTDQISSTTFKLSNSKFHAIYATYKPKTSTAKFLQNAHILPFYNTKKFKLENFETKEIDARTRINTSQYSGLHSVTQILHSEITEIGGKPAVVQCVEGSENGQIFVDCGEFVEFWYHFDIEGAPAPILNMALKKKALQLVMLEE